MVRFLPIAVVIVAFTLSPALAGEYFVKHTGVDRPAAAPTEDTALVYWVRPTVYGGGIKSWAFVDDQVVGTTKAAGYFFANVPAGTHIFWSKAENVSMINLEVLAGHTYYFEHDIRTGDIKAQVRQTVLTEQQGKNALAKCDYYEITEAGRQRGSEIAANRFAAVQRASERRAIPMVTAAVPETTEGMVLVRAGTEVEVELMENLSSRHTTEGEHILFRTTHDLEIDESITVQKGRLLRGIVHYVEWAGVGGSAGEVDVVLPALVTRDGIEIPVVGRVIVEGRDTHEKSGVMTAAFGVFGHAATKGKAAYVLAGERYVLTVREDTWVPDRTEVERQVAEREVRASANTPELQTENCEIKFKPESRKPVKDVVVCIESSEALTAASLVAVGELTLLDPFPATSIKRRKPDRWDVTLPGWSVLRYVRTEDRNQFDVQLGVTGVLDDGTRVKATSVLSIEIVEKTKS